MQSVFACTYSQTFLLSTVLEKYFWAQSCFVTSLLYTVQYWCLARNGWWELLVTSLLYSIGVSHEAAAWELLLHCCRVLVSRTKRLHGSCYFITVQYWCLARSGCMGAVTSLLYSIGVSHEAAAWELLLHYCTVFVGFQFMKYKVFLCNVIFCHCYSLILMISLRTQCLCQF